MKWGAVLVCVATACGPDGPADDPSLEEVCEGFEAPAREDVSACNDVDIASPAGLVSCLRGSGNAGYWSMDEAGLPTYTLAVEHRCDPAGYSESQISGERAYPVHLVGNARGVVAMAHASGAVELYSQDRGAKWLNKIDTWRDPEDDDYPFQVGGGYSYLVVDGEVRSTRFDDLPAGEALERQTRIFGVGYVETVTKFDDLIVRRRVLAPDSDARALVAEITIENLTDQYKEVGLVELWDVNVHQVVPAEEPTDADAWAALQRSRRQVMDGFEQTVTYSSEDRIAVVETAARSLPDGVSDRDSVSDVDWFVDPIYLAAIDEAETPSAVWLSDDEVWDGPRARRPPSSLEDGDGDSRSVTLAGESQRALVAVRIPVQVPTEAPVTRRFAFGYAPIGHSVDEDVAVLREEFGELAANASDAWKERMVWLAVPGADGAGALQREVAWASYATQAGAVYDEYFGMRAIGQGGAARYVEGQEGAAGDLALLAEALLLIDPALARETLTLALATQHGKSSDVPYYFPPAVTGVGDGAGGDDQRTDAYALLPGAVARYVGITRELSFLDADVPYWPRSSGDTGTVLDHLSGAMSYAQESLGTGGRGFLALGQSDCAAPAPGLAGGGDGDSSLYNAGAAVLAFPRVADVVASRDAGLAAAYGALADDQRALLADDGWSGEFYYRGFDAGGDPLVPDAFFLEPQLFAILAGAADATRRDALLARIEDLLETPIGAVASSAADGSDSDDLYGAIRPAANAWLTEAYALRDPEDGWASLWRNSLAARAEAYPDSWVGIWTGPSAFSGPALAEAGAADARVQPAAGIYPAQSAHVHAALLRAVFGLLGVDGGADWLRIAPRLPGATWAVLAPRFELASTPGSLIGALQPSAGGTVRLEVLLPVGLQDGDLTVRVDGAVVEATRTGDVLSFDVPLKKNARVTWSISG